MLTLDLSTVEKASLIFNNLLNDSVVGKIISEMKPLDARTTNVSKESLEEFVAEYAIEFDVRVQIFRPWNRWTSMYATTYTGNYELIKLNKYKLNRSLASICGSIAHEWGHCLEYFVNAHIDRTFDFNHGENKVDQFARDHSFQYQLGRAIKRYVQDNYEELLQDIGA
jgi:hypothetical protein